MIFASDQATMSIPLNPLLILKQSFDKIHFRPDFRSDHSTISTDHFHSTNAYRPLIFRDINEAVDERAQYHLGNVSEL
jgi:hypothetical protein